MAGVLRGLDLNTQVVHNIVVVGSTTPPRRFLFSLFRSVSFVLPFYPSLFLFLFLPASCRPSLLLPYSFFFLFLTAPCLSSSLQRTFCPTAAAWWFRRTLSSIKAEGIDAEMIEHCAPQCSSMYRSALRAQREYVVHRSNWTMIDDVMSAPPRRLALASRSFPRFLPLFFALCLAPSLFSLRRFER